MWLKFAVGNRGWLGSIECKLLDPPGSKWVNDGANKPTMGTEINNEALAAALSEKKEFTEAELDTFKEPNLSYDNYIKVDGGYFKPAKEMFPEFQCIGCKESKSLIKDQHKNKTVADIHQIQPSVLLHRILPHLAKCKKFGTALLDSSATYEEFERVALTVLLELLFCKGTQSKGECKTHQTFVRNYCDVVNAYYESIYSESNQRFVRNHCDIVNAYYNSQWWYQTREFLNNYNCKQVAVDTHWRDWFINTWIRPRYGETVLSRVKVCFPVRLRSCSF